ncbi:AraC family transcriptional regulator [Tsukamurella sp. NPDC003166]|uniref:AraC family transcriptional regulator n=1 Tax=Tsukamurella sp. NPDC003166 TaxID=3154444 RepID=UPI0033B7E66D
MPDSPSFFADRLDEGPDALSALLRAARLRGGRVRRGRATGPVALRVADRRVAHLAVSPGVTVQVGGTTVPLAPSDMALLARGDEHVLSGPDGAEWVTGEFTADHAIADPVLAVLPPVIHCTGAAPDALWLRTSLELLLRETDSPSPGSHVMAARILDLLFIHALRRWAAEAEVTPGWLTAAMDPRLGPVLTAVHAHPEHPWSIDELARIAALSRSALAARFTRLLGMPPAAYVTAQRLDRAAELLRDTDSPVGEVGTAVGYASEAGFSRAFHRRFGAPPLRWRGTVG